MAGTDKTPGNSETTQLIEKGQTIRKPKYPSFRRKMAVLISSVVISGLINGMIFGMPVFYPELIAAFNAKRSDAVLVQSLYSGISTGGGILFTPVIKRYGIGPCTFVSIIAGTVFFGINLLASSLTMVIVTVGICAGLVTSLCYLVPFISVSWIFHGDPGVALVVVTVGSSAGQFILPYLNEIFIQHYQWRGALLICGALVAHMFPFALIIHCSREYFDTGAGSTQPKEENADKRTRTFDLTLFKDIVTAPILLCCFLLALTGNVEAWFMVDILVSRGFEREKGSLAVSIAGLAMCFGRLIGLTVQHKCRIPSVCHWIYVFPLVGIGHAVVINLVDYTAILVTCFCTGTAFGVATSQTPPIMFEASGRERYPQGMAMVNLMYGLGNFFSGVLGGSIRDAYGDYKPMFYLGSAAALTISLLAMTVACILKRRPVNTEEKTIAKYDTLDS